VHAIAIGVTDRRPKIHARMKTKAVSEVLNIVLFFCRATGKVRADMFFFYRRISSVLLHPRQKSDPIILLRLSPGVLDWRLRAKC